MSTTPRIAFLASQIDDAQEALAALTTRHGQCQPEEADVLCALGGDGFMLQTLHRYGSLARPVFGPISQGIYSIYLFHHLCVVAMAMMSWTAVPVTTPDFSTTLILPSGAVMFGSTWRTRMRVREALWIHHRLAAAA